MNSTTEIGITLDCCKAELSVSLSQKDAPFLAPGRLRKNVTCPCCASVVIISVSKHVDGTTQTIQEVID